MASARLDAEKRDSLIGCGTRPCIDQKASRRDKVMAQQLDGAVRIARQRRRHDFSMFMGQIPFTLGMDVCGVVDAAGEGATEWVGRRVVAMTNQSLGGMAEFALARHSLR